MTEFEEFLKEILFEEKDKHKDFVIDKIEAISTAWGFIYRLVDTKDCWVTGLTQFKYRGSLTECEKEVLKYGAVFYTLNETVEGNTIIDWAVRNCWS